MRDAFMTLRKRASRTEGAQLVEFGLILPVLLLILLGIINFGYVFGQKLSLNQAVREGARKAVVDDDADAADVRDYVRAATGGLISPTTDVNPVTSLIQDPATATGTFSTSGTCKNYDKLGGQLQVTAKYQPKWLVPLPLNITAPSLTSVAVFRCEVI